MRTFLALILSLGICSGARAQNYEMMFAGLCGHYMGLTFVGIDDDDKPAYGETKVVVCDRIKLLRVLIAVGSDLHVEEYGLDEFVPLTQEETAEHFKRYAEETTRVTGFRLADDGLFLLFVRNPNLGEYGFVIKGNPTDPLPPIQLFNREQLGRGEFEGALVKLEDAGTTVFRLKDAKP